MWTLVLLKVFSTRLVVMIWPIDFAILSLYTVGIKPFWYIKFKKRFFFLLWSKSLRLKSLWCDRFYGSVWFFLKNISKCFQMVLFCCWVVNISTLTESISSQLMLRPSLILESNFLWIYIIWNCTPSIKIFSLVHNDII